MTPYIQCNGTAVLWQNDHDIRPIVAKLEKLSAYFAEIYKLFLGSVDYLTRKNVEHVRRA